MAPFKHNKRTHCKGDSTQLASSVYSSSYSLNHTETWGLLDHSEPLGLYDVNIGIDTNIEVIVISLTT